MRDSDAKACAAQVWDSFGRNLFVSKALEFTVTSVAWSWNGELFAVGLYNSLRLCDRTGWTFSREHVDTGSVTKISWTSDCTQLAAVSASGAVLFGQVRALVNATAESRKPKA